MNTKYKTLLGFAALIVASGVPASLYATPQQATATISHAGAEPAQASVPRLIQFNGTLKDATTHPVSGVASVTFAIYSEQDGGSPLWSETQNVLADALGHYNVLLGSATTGASRRFIWHGPITLARHHHCATTGNAARADGQRSVCDESRRRRYARRFARIRVRHHAEP